MLSAIPKITVDELFAESVHRPANVIHPENDLQSLLSFLADDCGADIRISHGISLKQIEKEVSAAAIAIRSRWGEQMQDQHHVILERIHRGIVIVENLGKIISVRRRNGIERIAAQNIFRYSRAGRWRI